MPCTIGEQEDSYPHHLLESLWFPTHCVTRQLGGDSCLRGLAFPCSRLQVSDNEGIVASDVSHAVNKPVPLAVVKRLFNMRPAWREGMTELLVCLTVPLVV